MILIILFDNITYICYIYTIANKVAICNVRMYIFFFFFFLFPIIEVLKPSFPGMPFLIENTSISFE